MYIDRCEFPIQERIEVTTKNNRVYVFEGEGSRPCQSFF